MAKLGSILSYMFLIKGAAWRLHESPASGWSRLTTLPLLSLAIFFRIELGSMFWLALGFSIGWLLLNPFLFSSGYNHNDWMSRGCKGEQVLLGLKKGEFAHHQKMVKVTLAITSLGLIPLIYGLYALDWKLTFWGLFQISIGKMWFIDRMNWLYSDHESCSNARE